MQNNKKIYLCVLAVNVCLLLAACHTEHAPLVWDGEWQRTIYVPKGTQGRCVNEILTIKGKVWFLTAIVHSTFECNQPFLELSYEGSIKEVKIKKDTDDRDIRLQIEGIHLAGIVDVAGSDRAVLSASAVKNLSEKYVPKTAQFFEQKSYLSKDAAVMKSDIFKPVLDFAIPGYPAPARQINYKRVKSFLPSEEG